MIARGKKIFHNINSGFTLIEMIVSISIMVIIGIFGMYSLQNYFVGYDIKKISQKIVNDIDFFDNEIYASQNSSYEIEFSGGSLGYIINKNFFKKSNLISLNNIDFVQASGSIQTSNTSTGMGVVKIYFDNLFNSSYIYTSTGSSINFLFSGSINLNYKINSFFNYMPINELNIIYFSKDNLLDEEAKKIKLISISSGSNLYEKIKIKNILGNKEILYFTGSSSGSMSSANLNFEKGGLNFSIEIKK